MRRRSAAPALDLRQFRVRPLDDDLASAEIDRSASPSIESQSPSLIASPASCALRLAASTVSPAQPTMQGLPIWRATSAACAVRPPTAVTMPADDRKARHIGRAGIGPHQDDRIAAGGEALGACRIEGRASDRDAGGGAGAARRPARAGIGKPLAARARPRRSRRAAAAPRAGVISPSLTKSMANRSAACGVRLAARVCRIHNLPSSMVNSTSCTSREFAFEQRQRLAQLRGDAGSERRDRRFGLRRAAARDDVLALRVEQDVDHRLCGAGRRIARERDAGAR